MTFTYFNEIPNKSTCVGNTLSTINFALTSLAWNLSALSAYTGSAINFLQSEVNFISANVPTYNYVQTNFVNTSGDTMTGTLSAPTLCASNIYVAASTLYFFNPVTKQVVESLRSTDVTNFKRTYGTVSALSANWASSKAFSNIAYVDPQTGSDSTGNGTPSRPWATLSKAVTEGYSVVYLGFGNAGGLTLSQSTTLYILGEGRFNSRIGEIQCSSFDIIIHDIGKYSFSVAAATNIVANGPSQMASGSVTLHGVYAPFTEVYCQGGDSFTEGIPGGDGGNIIINDSEIAGITSNGGAGGAGDGVTPGGNGGNGGLITIYKTKAATIASFGGAGGTDGGAGGGSSGTDGTLNIQWSSYDSIGGGTSDVVVANIVAGTFTP